MEGLFYAEWNPLNFNEDEAFDEELDLSQIATIAKETVQLANQENITLGENLDAAIHGREVGDDRVDISRCAEKICCAQVVQQSVIKMVTSPEDTGIRRLSWNFCEVSSMIPTDPFTGYDHARKRGDFSNLGYNDSVILRIIADVSKGDEHHSSTPPGKMSMLGSRLATPRRENRATWHIASLFQDAMLCTHKASEPKYLPQAMGGTGVTALFDNPENINLYVRAYKGGSYARIYGTATNELSVSLQYLERGLQTAPVLCSRLREKQDYFWGTYDQYVFIPNRRDLPSTTATIPEPLYEATGGANRYSSYENRLLRTRHVVTRHGAEREWATTQRQESILSGFYTSVAEANAREADIRRIAKSKFGNALHANSALCNLLKREATMKDAKKMMGDQAFRTITVGKRTFERSDAVWIYHNGQGENYSLNDISLSEDIFDRTEVSVEETFKVAGIPLQPITESGIPWKPTKTKVGLYQINQSMEDWSENLMTRLKLERGRLGRPLKSIEVEPIFDADPEWVNDDSGLVARCLREHATSSGRVYSVALVSDDKRLGNLMANTANLTVLRIPSMEYIRYMEGVNQRVQTYPRIKEILPALGSTRPIPDHIYYDTGSIAAAASQLDYLDGTKTFVRRDLDMTGWSGLSRVSRFRLTPITAVKTMRFRLHRPIERPKQWRQGSRPSESVYSEHSTWRNSNMSDSSWRRRNPGNSEMGSGVRRSP